MSSLRIFNYEKQKESDKDLKFNLRLRLAAKINLPLKVDMRESKFIPAVLDQGNLGASTANACSNVLRYILHKEKNRDFQPSRLYMYWFSRFLEGKKEEDGDCNSTIRNTLTSIHTFGACDETLIPYNVNKFKMKPSNQCVRNATQNIKEFKYLSLEPSLLQIKQCLNGGFPIVFAMDVYESFESEIVASTGVVSLPETTEHKLGGHVVAMYGYDDSKKRFLVMNSWGAKWGENGYFYLPYDYIKYMYDMWTMKLFE
jgi:C1A family cysteine protease